MTQEDCDIRIVVFIGSVRPGNMTAKASALIVDEIDKHKDAAVEVIDPAEIDLALPGTAKDSSVMDNLQQQVSDATGIIFATPEYHGSYSSVIKLIIEQLGYPSVLSGKPIALLGVAAADCLVRCSCREHWSHQGSGTPAQCLLSCWGHCAPRARVSSRSSQGV